MSRIVGIDLGTTNSAVATIDSGIPLVIAYVVGIAIGGLAECAYFNARQGINRKV